MLERGATLLGSFLVFAVGLGALPPERTPPDLWVLRPGQNGVFGDPRLQQRFPERVGLQLGADPVHALHTGTDIQNSN